MAYSQWFWCVYGNQSPISMTLPLTLFHRSVINIWIWLNSMLKKMYKNCSNKNFQDNICHRICYYYRSQNFINVQTQISSTVVIFVDFFNFLMAACNLTNGLNGHITPWQKTSPLYRYTTAADKEHLNTAYNWHTMQFTAVTDDMVKWSKCFFSSS